MCPGLDGLLSIGRLVSLIIGERALLDIRLALSSPKVLERKSLHCALLTWLTCSLAFCAWRTAVGETVQH